MGFGNSITVKDIASMAGVSIGTVDRVLHKRGRVARLTEEKILSIIRETGYERNLHASNLAQARSYTIGVLTPYPEQDSGFWKLPHEGMVKAVQELKPYMVDLKFSCFDRFSSTSFNQAAEQLMEMKPDGILLAPVLPEVAEVFAANLPAGFPLCCFDADLPENKKLAYIGQDSFASGRLAAKLMKMMVPAGGRTIIIQAVVQDYHIRDRIEGFRSAYNKWEKPSVFVEEKLEDPEVCRVFLEEVFRTVNDVAGIFVSNDSAHLVAAELKRRGGGKIFLLGYDLIPENRRFLEAGEIDFILNQRPGFQGYLGVQTIFRELIGQPAGMGRIIMPIDILTAENVGCYRVDVLPGAV